MRRFGGTKQLFGTIDFHSKNIYISMEVNVVTIVLQNIFLLYSAEEINSCRFATTSG